jgi:SAM-dependent methyltransferase
VKDMIDVDVDPTNRAQATAWDGDEGAYWADNAAWFDRAVAAHHRPFMAAAGIETTERVLDVGCGAGQTTRDAAREAACGSALGVDLSARMIAIARQAAVAGRLANATFEQADAQIYPFPAASFDLVISRTGAMFFGDPIAAFTNIGRALRPGGRLVLLTWQGPGPNEWMRELSSALAAGRHLPPPPPEAPGPFALSDPDRVRAVLGAAGFGGVDLDARQALMWFGGDVDAAHQFVLGLMGWMLQGLDDAGRNQALDNLRDTLAAHATDGGVMYDSAAWIIRASRP